MKIHFIGIGGIGMSALAEICLARGDSVSGSDLRPNNLTDELATKGAVIHKGHLASNVPLESDLVVSSTCIRSSNPEIKKAEELDLKIISRGQLLLNIMESFPFSASITGTHGKTTTSALVSHIMENCGKDPTVIVGGEMDVFGGNAKPGAGEIVVAEVDESDGFFRNIKSTCAIITNIEREHMEHYGEFENLIDAYKSFIRGISPGGFLVFNGEDKILRTLAPESGIRNISFGIEGDFDVTCRNFNHSASITFDLVVKGQEFTGFTSKLIGRYNLMNILAASSLCAESGIDPSKMKEAISTFSGVKRRFETIGSVGNIKVVEDYAHHPTELRSVIDAARESSKGRVVAVFQPHRYSRTRDLLDDFSKCFDSADVLVLTDIYSADEDSLEGLSIKDLHKSINSDIFEMTEVVKKEDIPLFISEMVKDGDVILVLGAGDIRDISVPTVNAIKKKLEI